MRTKHVVHISLGTEIGGMERLLVQFARFTDPENYRTTFISLEAPGELADELNSFRSPVLSVHKPQGLSLASCWRLAGTLRRIRPDVVHTHNTAAYFYGVPAALWAGVPRIIHTRHGQRANATGRQNLVFRRLSPWVDRVVSVSEDGHRLTMAEGIDAAKAISIRNGVDIERFSIDSHRPENCIVVVARLSPEKDVQSLIRAVDIINRDLTLPAQRVHVDIYGDGSQRRDLETLAESLGYKDEIRFHGMRSDIPDVLKSASLFVLPSTTEGISLTILEAMAAGLPVIACDVGGNPEVVVNGETGTLVPPRDPQALAHAIEKIRRDRSLANRMGRNGRARVEKHFCVRKMVRAYESLYEGKAA